MTYQNKQYCCISMKDALGDPRIFFGYSSKYREYYIKTDHPMIVHTITHCPWCGTTLPKSVRDEWFYTLDKEYGIDNPRYEEQEKLIPAEFKTDEWWKKRKL